LKYENPRIPEGINVSTRHPLKEFASLSLWAVGLLLVLALAAVLVGGFLGRHMPFSWEKGLADAALDWSADDPEAERALQDLADRLVDGMDLPPGMTITVHYVGQPVVNAMATIGGHIIVFRGLLARLPHENALAMLLGHEIAHVRNRDAAAGIGSGALLTLIAVAVTGRSSALIDRVADGTSLLVLLRFGRDAERAADHDGLAALAGLYGHIDGAEDLYQVLAELVDPVGQPIPEILQSHPLTKDRQAAISALAEARGWRRNGPLTALPPALIVPLPDTATGSD